VAEEARAAALAVLEAVVLVVVVQVAAGKNNENDIIEEAEAVLKQNFKAASLFMEFPMLLNFLLFYRLL
jgi:hypothetical protein